MGCLGFQNVGEFVLFITSIMSGMVILLGMNAVNSTPQFMIDYYKYIKNDKDAVADYPQFWMNVLTYYTIVTEVSQAVLQPLNLIPFFRRFSYLFRLELGSLIALGEILIILLMPHASTPESGAVVGVLIAAFIGGLGRAVFENTVFALFGTCPSRTVVGAMVGLPASGAIMSLVQIILLGSMAGDFNSILKQSVIYFSIGIAIIFVSSSLLLCLFFNSFAKNYIPELRSTRSAWKNIYRPLRLSDDTLRSQTVGNAPEDGNAPTLHRTRNALVASPDSDAVGSVVTESKEEPNSMLETDSNEEPAGLISTELLQRVSLWHVVKKIYPMQIACFLNFFVTLLIYPGVFLAVDRLDSWYTTLVIAIFNFTDLASRMVLVSEKLKISRKAVLILSIVRIVLVPLVVLCGYHKIPGKAAPYIFTGLMGLTSGYVGTLTMIYAPTTPGLKGNGEQAMAAQACDGALMLGCSLGALSQLGVVLAF
ncbi:unnamed protein product [Phytomonas sp. EM1]|nr:unnamed protein product [Phytomonas sp. EM1]|eukprot:CCW63487.1 unnamed protein product [Phytomonas sp. isolate EM1]